MRSYKREEVLFRIVAYGEGLFSPNFSIPNLGADVRFPFEGIATTGQGDI